MTVTEATDNALLRAVTDLRTEVEEAALPLDIPATAEAKANRASLLQQLDDYVIPRLTAIDAPLLAVVGGSTGAGKSTLVNSLVGHQVTRSGVRRPTTTSPVLVHHAEDAHWFTDNRVLPGLKRISGDEPGEGQPGTVRLVESESLPAGMALLDAPDIDSVVEANRSLSRQLLMAADLWLFTTTAARYADAVPWDLLRQASDRGTAVAIVLDRVPEDAIGEVRPHLASMLREQGLSTAPIFAIPETELTAEGFLPEIDIRRMKSWLEALAGDTRARSTVVRQTLNGAIASLTPRVDELIAASQEQQAATRDLHAAVDSSYGEARAEIEKGMTDGTLLRGEVLARWQEFVGTGEFFKKVETSVARWRDRITAAVKGEPAPAQSLDEALQSGVASLVIAQGEAAATATARRWRGLTGGEPLLERHPGLQQASPEFRAKVERVVRDWQGEVLELVRAEGQDRRTNARIAAYGVNGIGLVLMIVAFAHTGGMLGGSEVGIAGGASVLAQRLLEAIFGDQAVRTMARKARELLVGHVQQLLAEESERYTSAVEEVEVGADQAGQLRTASDAVKAAQ
ncbi:MAG: ABC transporter [Micrococcales bacterium]|nr:ABC transporter [Micrococcales bacterium]